MGFNRAFYRDPRADRLIADATAAASEADRAAAYQAAARVIAADLPEVSLWYRINTIVAQANLAGLSLSPTADFAFLANVMRRR